MGDFDGKENNEVKSKAEAEEYDEAKSEAEAEEYEEEQSEYEGPKKIVEKDMLPQLR